MEPSPSPDAPGASSALSAPPSPSPSEPPARPEAPCEKGLGHWVENDGLLRDEGVLFGFAAFRVGEDREMLEAKLACVDACYAPCLDAERAVHAALAEEHDRRRAERDAERAKEAERRAEASRLAVAELDPHDAGAAHQRLRFGVSGALAVMGAVLTGWIVYDHLVRSGLDHPLVVSAGLTLLGFASSFHPISALHGRHDVMRARTDHAEVWKLHVSEWLLPVVAAGFVGVYAQPAVGPARAVTVALLLAVAFAIVGKLVASTLTRFAIARRRGREEAAHAAEAARAAAHATACAEQHRACAEAHDARLAAVHEAMDEAERRIARVEGKVRYKRHLFLSEYHFGLRTMRTKAAAQGDGHASEAPFDLYDDHDAPLDASDAPGWTPPSLPDVGTWPLPGVTPSAPSKDPLV